MKTALIKIDLYLAQHSTPFFLWVVGVSVICFVLGKLYHAKRRKAAQTKHSHSK